MPPPPASPTANGDRSSVWDLRNPVASPARHLDRYHRADLVVVGGGIAGLTTALAATTAGLDVAVVEQARLAAGASGRTSGFVVPALRPLPGGRTLDEALGPERAGRFRTLAAASGQAVFDLIDGHRLDVPTGRAGWIAAAHTPDAFQRLGREAGTADRVLDADAIREVTGIDGWHGGVVYAGSGAVDPVAYVQALARAVTTVGSAVFEETRAEAIRPAAGGRVEIVCDRGRIDAAHVVVATNGSSRLVPEVAAGVIPVTVHQVVTRPLPEELRRLVLGRGHVVTDTRRNSIALRWTPDGRLLTGGLVGPSLRPAAAEARSSYGARLRAIVGTAARRVGLPLPALDPEMVWSGRIAITGTGLPLLFAAHPQVTAVVACNGRGIALGTALGTLLGRTIADGLGRGRAVDLDSIPLPPGPPKPRPVRYAAGIGARFRAIVAEALDRGEVGAAGQPGGRGRPT